MRLQEDGAEEKSPSEEFGAESKREPGLVTSGHSSNMINRRMRSLSLESPSSPLPANLQMTRQRERISPTPAPDDHTAEAKTQANRRPHGFRSPTGRPGLRQGPSFRYSAKKYARKLNPAVSRAYDEYTHNLLATSTVQTAVPTGDLVWVQRLEIHMRQLASWYVSNDVCQSVILCMTVLSLVTWVSQWIAFWNP